MAASVGKPCTGLLYIETSCFRGWRSSDGAMSCQAFCEYDWIRNAENQKEKPSIVHQLPIIGQIGRSIPSLSQPLSASPAHAGADEVQRGVMQQSCRCCTNVIPGKAVKGPNLVSLPAELHQVRNSAGSWAFLPPTEGQLLTRAPKHPTIPRSHHARPVAPRLIAKQQAQKHYYLR
ncbi:hypothetical protein B0T17DRAFT_511549 [Bombardia bombarda]|uniref:Uncharacterized protein n=1 Tax=Bombardia bombarda TaxID=252184 RepID=A0AA39U4N8_9PEZI|nr:hypothetical protein B0T17DRAFT_511549 [Bombardia bombarda]